MLLNYSNTKLAIKINVNKKEKFKKKFFLKESSS